MIRSALFLYVVFIFAATEANSRFFFQPRFLSKKKSAPVAIPTPILEPSSDTYHAGALPITILISNHGFLDLKLILGNVKEPSGEDVFDVVALNTSVLIEAESIGSIDVVCEAQTEGGIRERNLTFVAGPDEATQKFTVQLYCHDIDVLMPEDSVDMFVDYGHVIQASAEIQGTEDRQRRNIFKVHNATLTHTDTSTDPLFEYNIYNLTDSSSLGYGIEWEELSQDPTNEIKRENNSQISASVRSVSVPLKFPNGFEFYGDKYTSLFITSYGYVSFEAHQHNGDYQNLLTPEQPNNVIAPYINNFLKDTCNIFMKNEVNVFIVQYENCRDISNDWAYTFQVRLHPDGDIWFLYKDMPVNGRGALGVESKNGKIRSIESVMGYQGFNRTVVWIPNYKTTSLNTTDTHVSYNITLDSYETVKNVSVEVWSFVNSITAFQKNSTQYSIAPPKLKQIIPPKDKLPEISFFNETHPFEVKVTNEGGGSLSVITLESGNESLILTKNELINIGPLKSTIVDLKLTTLGFGPLEKTIQWATRNTDGTISDPDPINDMKFQSTCKVEFPPLKKLQTLPPVKGFVDSENQHVVSFDYPGKGEFKLVFDYVTNEKGDHTKDITPITEESVVKVGGNVDYVLQCNKQKPGDEKYTVFFKTKMLDDNNNNNNNNSNNNKNDNENDNKNKNKNKNDKNNDTDIAAVVTGSQPVPVRCNLAHTQQKDLDVFTRQVPPVTLNSSIKASISEKTNFFAVQTISTKTDIGYQIDDTIDSEDFARKLKSAGFTYKETLARTHGAIVLEDEASCTDRVCVFTKTLPFAFNFFNTAYNEIKISSNGFVQFGDKDYEDEDTNGSDPITLGTTDAPNNIIAAFFVNSTHETETSKVYFRATSQVVVIEWRDFGIAGCETDTHTDTNTDTDTDTDSKTTTQLFLFANNVAYVAQHSGLNPNCKHAFAGVGVKSMKGGVRNTIVESSTNVIHTAKDVVRTFVPYTHRLIFSENTKTEYNFDVSVDVMNEWEDFETQTTIVLWSSPVDVQSSHTNLTGRITDPKFKVLTPGLILGDEVAGNPIHFSMNITNTGGGNLPVNISISDGLSNTLTVDSYQTNIVYDEIETLNFTCASIYVQNYTGFITYTPMNHEPVSFPVNCNFTLGFEDTFEEMKNPVNIFSFPNTLKSETIQFTNRGVTDMFYSLIDYNTTDTVIVKNNIVTVASNDTIGRVEISCGGYELGTTEAEIGLKIMHPSGPDHQLPLLDKGDVFSYVLNITVACEITLVDFGLQQMKVSQTFFPNAQPRDAFRIDNLGNVVSRVSFSGNNVITLEDNFKIQDDNTGKMLNLKTSTSYAEIPPVSQGVFSLWCTDTIDESNVTVHVNSPDIFGNYIYGNTTTIQVKCKKSDTVFEPTSISQMQRRSPPKIQIFPPIQNQTQAKTQKQNAASEMSIFSDASHSPSARVIKYNTLIDREGFWVSNENENNEITFQPDTMTAEVERPTYVQIHNFIPGSKDRLYIHKKGYIFYTSDETTLSLNKNNENFIPDNSIVPFYNSNLTMSDDSKVYVQVTQNMLVITWANMLFDESEITFQLLASCYGNILFNYKIQLGTLWGSTFVMGVKETDQTASISAYDALDLGSQVSLTPQFTYEAADVLRNDAEVVNHVFPAGSTEPFEQEIPIQFPPCDNPVNVAEYIVHTVENGEIISAVIVLDSDIIIKCPNENGGLTGGAIAGITVGSAAGMAGLLAGAILLGVKYKKGDTEEDGAEGEQHEQVQYAGEDTGGPDRELTVTPTARRELSEYSEEWPSFDGDLENSYSMFVDAGIPEWNDKQINDEFAEIMS